MIRNADIAKRAKSPVPRSDSSTPIGFTHEFDLIYEECTESLNNRACILMDGGTPLFCRCMLPYPPGVINLCGHRFFECGARTVLRCDQCLRPACGEHCKLSSVGYGGNAGYLSVLVCAGCNKHLAKYLITD